MTQTVVKKANLQEVLADLLPNSTEEFQIKKVGNEIRLAPVSEPSETKTTREWGEIPKNGGMDAVNRIRGSLKKYPDMSLDQFLARKHANKGLES